MHITISDYFLRKLHQFCFRNRLLLQSCLHPLHQVSQFLNQSNPSPLINQALLKHYFLSRLIPSPSPLSHRFPDRTPVSPNSRRTVARASSPWRSAGGASVVTERSCCPGAACASALARSTRCSPTAPRVGASCASRRASARASSAARSSARPTSARCSTPALRTSGRRSSRS